MFLVQNIKSAFLRVLLPVLVLGGIGLMANDLLTFDDAQKWLKSRVNVPTAKGSAEIALSPDFPGQVRVHSFFTAKQVQANVLDKLRGEIDAIVAGETDMATARLKLKTFLAREGVARPDDVGTAAEPPAGMSEEDWKAAKQVSNLASTRRLNLILEQNALMAHAIGNRQVSMDPDVKERWPYFRYITAGDDRVRQDHAALNNLVLPKDHPFWQTHTPPWDFNCRCQLEDCDGEEAAKYGGVGAAQVTELPDGTQAGQVVTGENKVVNLTGHDEFVFRPDQAFERCDVSLIHNDMMRKEILPDLIAEAQKSRVPWRFTSRNEAPERISVPENIAEIGKALADIADGAAAGKLPDLSVSLGNLLPEHANAIGLKPEATSVRLTSPGPGTGRTGAKHETAGHSDVAANPGEEERILRESLWNAAADVRLSVIGKTVRLTLYNRPTNALTTMLRKGNGWDLETVSVWRPDLRYAKAQELL